jgi:hypothetical protein
MELFDEGIGNDLTTNYYDYANFFLRSGENIG